MLWVVSAVCRLVIAQPSGRTLAPALFNASAHSVQRTLAGSSSTRRAISSNGRSGAAHVLLFMVILQDRTDAVEAEKTRNRAAALSESLATW
jgi:hypothetical protein